MKLTDEYIASCIVKDEAFKIGAKTTLVVLTLKNGFEVVGTSACVDPSAYDQKTGEHYARERALAKVWELEGYMLQSHGDTPELSCHGELGLKETCTGTCTKETLDPSAA